MRTDIETFAQILSVAIWADGKYVEDERQYIAELATALRLDKISLLRTVDKSVINVEYADEETVNIILAQAAKHVDDDEKEVLVEAVADIVLSDGVLEKAEVENVLAVTQALNVDLAEGAKAIISYLAPPEKWTPTLQQEIDNAVTSAPSEEALTATLLAIAASVASKDFIVNQ